jgi:D-sedoheptulose 7-phosphate isomerase
MTTASKAPIQDNPDKFITEYLTESARIKTSLCKQIDQIKQIAQAITDIYKQGGRLYACGNGGSACDAMHLVEELVARYLRDRPGLPAQHFGDTGTLTCWSNDYEFKSAYERQVQALVTEKDVLVVFTTSGNSENLLMALAAAKKKKAKTIALLGRGGGKAKGVADLELIVDSNVTSQTQEAHIAIVHLICEFVETALFP